MDIKSLPRDVRAHLRSGANINSIAQCVTELVLNSLDAKSTAIAVRINLITFRIQVVDNGKGVTKSNMNLIGLRYMTSKCQSLADLRKIKRFGFRGEALSSIRSMSKKIVIVSRPDNVENTYSKTYENGKWNAVEVVKQRPSKGTTVTIEGFMHNLPVRQKRIHQNLDIHEIRRNLENLAVIHPHISFNLRNDTTGKIVFQCNKTKTVSQALANLYPEISIEDLLEIKICKNKISVSGLISKNHSTNTQLQFIYLNKRPIVSPKIQKLVNSLLLKSLIYRKPALNHCPENFLNLASPTEKTGHPIYALNIRCPYSEVDLTLSPSKKTVDFKHWNVVLNCVQKAVVKLLERENLVTINLTKEEDILPEAASFKSQFGVSQIQGAVKSVPIKRKNAENVRELPKKCSKINSGLNGSNIESESIDNISANKQKSSKTVDDQSKIGSSIRSSFNDIQEHANILTLAEVHNDAKIGKSKNLLNLSSSTEKHHKKISNTNLISSCNDVNVIRSNGRPDEFQNKHSKSNSKDDSSMKTFNKECFKIVPTITKHHKNKNIKGQPTLLGGTKIKRNSETNLNQNTKTNTRQRIKNVDKTNNRKRRDSKTTRNKANRSIQNLTANDILNYPDINIENKTAKLQINPQNIYFPKASDDSEVKVPSKPNQKIFPINTNNNIPCNVFEKHKNTQSLVLNSEINNTKANHNSLLNSTINTNILENQGKGKELIMDMFLKSTLVFPNEEPEIKDSAVETRVVETTKENVITGCRKQNTTMMTVSWKIMSKKTIVTNSIHPACNLEESVPGNEEKLSIPNDANQNNTTELNQNYEKMQDLPNTRPKKNLCKSAKDEMISKCIQTTMMEHQKEFKIEFNCVSQSGPDTNSKFIFSNSFPQSAKYNITFSKYFEKSFRSKPEQYCFPANCFELNNNRQGFYNLGESKRYDRGDSNFGFNLNENYLHNLRRQSKPAYNIDSYRPVNIPQFGTTECLHRPFYNYGIPENHYHQFPTSNIHHESYPITNNYTTLNDHKISNYNMCRKNFRKPIRNYCSDYNFDFSNLNTCGQPYREFMEKNYNFKRPSQRFPFASRTNPFNNNFINQQTTTCVENCYADELCDITVPLYQSYNPIKLNTWGPYPNFVREEPMNNNNNYCTTKWNAGHQYETRNTVEGRLQQKVFGQNCFNGLCNQNDGKTENNNDFAKWREGGGLKEELYQSIFRDYGQRSSFQHDQRINHRNKFAVSKPNLKNHNLVPEFARNVGVELLNNKRIIPNGKHYHHKRYKQSNCYVDGEVTRQKCSSPFFQKPAMKDKHNAKIARGSRQNSNPIMKNRNHLKPSQKVFTKEHLNGIHYVSPFFRQVSNDTPIAKTKTHFSHQNQKCAPMKEVSTYHKMMVPLHQPKSSPTREHLFASADYHQNGPFLLPSTKIFSAPWLQYLNHENKFLEEPEKLPLFVPKQPHCSPGKKNDFFFLDQKENHAEKSNTKWNEQKPQIPTSVNMFARQPSNQIVFDQHQSKEEKVNEWQYNSMFVINPEKDTQNDFLFLLENHQNNCPIIQPTKSKNVHQKFKLSLKKCNTEPLQSKVTHFVEAFSKEDPCIPQTNFNFPQKSRPTIDKFVTSHKKSKESSGRYKIDLSSDTKPFFGDLVTPQCNNVMEYSFLTPNINKSTTFDDTIEKISLYDSRSFDISNPQEAEAQSNLTVCSRNFKPALSSTRFDAVEETRKSKRTNTNLEKVPLENCSLSSGVIEGTPTKILSNFFVPSLNQIIASKSQPRRANDNSSKKSCSALNITINEIKKSKLIEKGMDEDCKLNRQSVSCEIDQSNINLGDSADCNMKHFVNHAKNSGVVDHQTGINNVPEEKNDEWIQNVNMLGDVFYIHKRTGMTSMFRPKQDSHFNLIKRIEFVPKGFSPIFTEKKKIDASLSPTSKKSLHAAILENYESELKTIKWSNYIYNYNDGKAFFEDLYREKTKQFQYHIPNAGLNELPKSMVKLYNEVQAHSFTKDIFTELQIIGQLDKKFIITLLTSRKLIILFDQHAVHERARLEQLLNDYKEAASDMETIKYKSAKYHEKVIITLTSAEINILANFKNLFQNLGLQYTLVGNDVEITHIPLCIYNKSIGSKEKSKEICLDNINTLIKEQFAMLMSTRGISSKIPNILQNIINSEACRGAIKFGDKLTISECEKYLKQLSVCQLPFQCAHGRPTLIPVVSLKQNYEVKQMKPNLIKLHSK